MPKDKQPNADEIIIRKLSEKLKSKGFLDDKIIDNVPQRIINKLLNSNNWTVRRALTMQKNLSEASVKKLSNDDYYEVRRLLASRKDLIKYPQIIKNLALDRHSGVQVVVFRRKDIPKRTLFKFYDKNTNDFWYGYKDFNTGDFKKQYRYVNINGISTRQNYKDFIRQKSLIKARKRKGK